MRPYPSTVLRVVAAASVAVGVVSFTSPATAQARVQPAQAATYADAVPGLAPPGLGDHARYVDEQGRTIDPATNGKIDPATNGKQDGEATTSAIGCTPVTLPDDPHWSSPDVSGHGQWNKGDCTSNTAHVQNCLYEYYTDGTWRRKACSATVQLKPKTESNNRTTARRTCDSTSQLISWRNHVDVDVDGEVDSSGTEYHQASVYCVVTGPDQ